jgi:hypothetical protein
MKTGVFFTDVEISGHFFGMVNSKSEFGFYRRVPRLDASFGVSAHLCPAWTFEIAMTSAVKVLGV